MADVLGFILSVLLLAMCGVLVYWATVQLVVSAQAAIKGYHEKAKASDLRTKVDELTKYLQKYGRHLPECARERYLGSMYYCPCGWLGAEHYMGQEKRYDG